MKFFSPLTIVPRGSICQICLKRKYCSKRNLCDVILSEKVQWHIRIFEAKSKRFKMLIKNVGKEVHRILAYHKPEVATFLWNDVKNDGYCRVTKSVRFFSKRIKMLDFTSRSDLLLSDSQHFEF